VDTDPADGAPVRSVSKQPSATYSDLM